MNDKPVVHALAHPVPKDSVEVVKEDGEEGDDGGDVDDVNPHTDMPHTEVTPRAHEVTPPLTFVSIVEQAKKDGVSSRVSPTHSRTHSLAYARSLSPSLTHSLTHLPTHSLANSFSHTLTHSDG
jgi:hypothetical protein